MPYHSFMPARPRHPLLVMVHGVSTRPERLLQYGARLAGRYGVPLLVPDFTAPEYRGYQRLKGGKSDYGAATGLLAALQDMTRRHDLPPAAFSLMGFSAGAQFAHRFALHSPHHVRSLLVAAPGWYTCLDRGIPYPFGLGEGAESVSRRHLDEFLKLPIMVAVGEEDTRRDSRLRTSVSLDRRQGRNRFERAQRWFLHLNQEAEKRAIAGRYSFVPLAGTGHSLSQAVKTGGLMEHLFRFVSEPVVSAPSKAAPAPISTDLSAAVRTARSRFTAEYHS